jgi:hypothetical protein
VYLKESFTFYDAIRSRKYFEGLSHENKPEIYLKKLRFYARFILVCLLYAKKTFAITLRNELSDCIKTYENLFSQNIAEWKTLIVEFDLFCKFDMIVKITDNSDWMIYKMNHGKEVNGFSDAIIMSNQENQIKFSELSLNMFRVHSSLLKSEKQPKTTLLYRPTIFDLQTTLANATIEFISPNQSILLYISADSNKDHIKMKKQDPIDSTLVLEDLIPFTRKPIFAIFESQYGEMMQPTENKFSQPFVVICSNNPNSILTLFLTSPIQAFYYLNKIFEMDLNTWTKLNTIFETEIEKITESLRIISSTFDYYLNNSIAKNYLLRFVFARVVLEMNGEPLPTIFPEIPKQFYTNEVVTNLINMLKQ